MRLLEFGALKVESRARSMLIRSEAKQFRNSDQNLGVEVGDAKHDSRRVINNCSLETTISELIILICAKWLPLSLSVL
jgi:hypothetical protein